MQWTLYKRELRCSWKMLLVFVAILTLYISMIVGMYDPMMSSLLEGFEELMPELMAAVGMNGNATTLLGFMSSYLYGMILIAFPMVFCIIRANGLVAKYVDRGSMVTLLTAPVKRSTIILTQISVLLTGIFFLDAYITILEILCAELQFPGELQIPELLVLNMGLFFLHTFIGSICFLCSCIFNETKHSVAFGAGIPAVMYIIQMLANMGGKLEKAKYGTFFTLFSPDGLIADKGSAYLGIVVLLLGTICFYSISVLVFNKKDLHI
jgi:ABC-2 type transport system permease protein